MDISGNFNTSLRETEIVKSVLEHYGIEYKNLKKYYNADDADVSFESKNKEITVEVKKESFTRFSKYKDFGFDFLSVFQFKENKTLKGLHRGEKEVQQFFETIDFNKYHKKGKIFYSKADIWLFFVKDGNEKFYRCALFDGKKITTDEFREQLMKNCYFAVNNKSDYQNSKNDKYSSATFFVNSEWEILNPYRITDLKSFIENLHK